MSEKTLLSLLKLLAKILIIAIITILYLVFVGGVHVVHDNYMFPALKDGDLAITYKLNTPYNGDIIAYSASDNDGKTSFGRVVGIPGDVINITNDGSFTVNGLVPYEVIYYQTMPLNSSITYPYTVNDGEVFVLSDMREEGHDSRIYGGITKHYGKVVLLLRRRGF